MTKSPRAVWWVSTSQELSSTGLSFPSFHSLVPNNADLPTKNQFCFKSFEEHVAFEVLHLDPEHHAQRFCWVGGTESSRDRPHEAKFTIFYNAHAKTGDFLIFRDAGWLVKRSDFPTGHTVYYILHSTYSWLWTIGILHYYLPATLRK